MIKLQGAWILSIFQARHHRNDRIKKVTLSKMPCPEDVVACWGKTGIDLIFVDLDGREY
jgi:hypothetical protein